MARRSPDSDASFILLILLAGTVWTHKAFMLQVQNIALLVALALAGLISLIWLVKLTKRVKRWRLRRHPAMTAIDQMAGLEFERCVATLLRQQGYTDIHITEKYDLGVDITAEKNGLRWGIQVKRYSGLVKADAVRQVVTALRRYECDRAMVITNSMFSRVARELADSNSCLLIDRNKLHQWVEPHANSTLVTV